MPDRLTSDRPRRAAVLALKVLLPFSAMRQTAELARREAERTKDNLVVLKGLGRSARQAVWGTPDHELRDESFEEAMARRRPDAMTIPELRRHFATRKRVALVAAATFGACSVLQLLFGLWNHSLSSVLFGGLSLLGGQPMFIVVALGAQFRIWQLDTQRLSAREHGGLGDFLRENPRWWLAILIPKFDQDSKEHA
ncbi:MAG TPA: hypothetical protein VFP68_01500 [Burkholderiaceae bacterium]|nr:hypothetical protein [Burkholderiaceae bacterium]